MTNEGLQAIGNALERNNSLTSLSLCFNHSDMNILYNSLLRNSTLINLFDTSEPDTDEPNTDELDLEDMDDSSNPNSINTIKNQLNTQTLTDNSPVQSDDFQSKSYVEFTDLRHPIVEQLIKSKYEYIPHSLTLGKGTNGIMLYGLNSAGKSVLMKAIGISVIMAQCHHY